MLNASFNQAGSNQIDKNNLNESFAKPIKISKLKIDSQNPKNIYNGKKKFLI